MDPNHPSRPPNSQAPRMMASTMYPNGTTLAFSHQNSYSRPNIIDFNNNTTPDGSSGYTQQETYGLPQYQHAPGWRPNYQQDGHSIPSHEAHHSNPAANLHMMAHSQAPSQSYHHISPVGQLNPMMNNLDMSGYMPQVQNTTFLHPNPYAPPRTSAGWAMRIPATAGPSTSIETLGVMDSQPNSTGHSPTSNGVPPAVGRQGTRGILPSAPGRDEPGNEDEIEPMQDPETKKWCCPSCPATFSFPKHVKRHYMRHTGERPYECLCCRTCFARSDVLKRHYEKCAERTPGWREIPPEDRADHLQGRRGRPKRAAAKKQQARRRQGRTPGPSGQNSHQSSRRNSRDENQNQDVYTTLAMTNVTMP